MEKSPFSKIDQIGVVVRDMDKAIEYYESLGIGPFMPFRKLVFVKRELYGEPVGVDSMKVKITAAQMGSVQIELIQPVEGRSHWMDFLQTRGEGIQHLGFFCGNIEEEEAKALKKGFKPVYSSRYEAGGGAAYLDTGIGDIIVELINLPWEQSVQMEGATTKKAEIEKSPFSNLHHIGAIVKDADKAAECFESLGMGAFEPLSVTVKERRIWGKLSEDYKARVRQAHVGPVRFELVQLVGGESPQMEFLEKKGEGIHHLAFVVEGIDDIEEGLIEKGLTVNFRSRYLNGGATTYFETDKIGGILFELFQRPSDYVPRD